MARVHKQAAQQIVAADPSQLRSFLATLLRTAELYRSAGARLGCVSCQIIMLYYDGKGQYQKEFGELWRQLVPASGQANTVQGEFVRVITKLEDECLRNGNINWDMGHLMFTNFLHKYLRDAKVFDAETISQIESDVAEIRDFGRGKKEPDFKDNEEDAFDRITNRIVEWCQKNPEPIRLEKNPKLKR